jgi:hypothetical protein
LTRLDIVPVLTADEAEPDEQLTDYVRMFLVDHLEDNHDSGSMLLWAREARIENLAEWAGKYNNLWMTGRPAEGIRNRMGAASLRVWREAAEHASSESSERSILHPVTGCPNAPHAVSVIVESDEKRTAYRESQDPSSLEIIQPQNLSSRLVDWSIPDESSSEIIKEYLQWEGQNSSKAAANQFLFGLSSLKEALRLKQWDYLLARYSELEGETWLQNLALAWLRWKREEDRAVPIQIRRAIVTNTSGDQFTPLPLALEQASYLFGGPVVVNGEKYAREPGQTGDVVGQLLKPRAIDIVPEEWTKSTSRQLSFEPMEMDFSAPFDQDVEEFLIVSATNAAASSLELPAMAAKLVPLMFATSPMDGRPVHGTLEGAASLLYPNLTGRNGRKHKQRDLVRIGAALAAMRRLRIVEKRDNGKLHSYSLFSVAYDLSAEANAEIEWALDPLLAARMKGGGNEKGGGFFLVNFSRLMEMDIKNPRLFALYLRLAGMWNSAKDFKAGKFRPELFRPVKVDTLAALSNAIPRNAAEYMAGKRTDQSSRVAYYESRKRIISDLEDLKERGLVGEINLINPHGKDWTVQPMPDADLQEAYRQAVRKERRTGDE